MHARSGDKAFNLFETGPFPNRIDPWAEDDTYFHAIHESMIDAMLRVLREPLFKLGYRARRERSLQIAEGRKPDLFVNLADIRRQKQPRLNYELAAGEVLAPIGEVLHEEPWLDALHIHIADGTLVTVIEIISPRNKDRAQDINAYKERRSRLYLERDVRVVEIDLTRSVKRLVERMSGQSAPYFAAVFIPGEAVRVIALPFDSALERIAIPLITEVVAVDLQHVYTTAYQTNMTAQHIEEEHRYTDEYLPFPSLLTDEQRSAALDAVRVWQDRLRKMQSDK
jgi:hypothetical protein